MLAAMEIIFRMLFTTSVLLAPKCLMRSRMKLTLMYPNPALRTIAGRIAPPFSATWSIAGASSPDRNMPISVNPAPMRLAWYTTSACEHGSGTSKKRRSSKFPAAESAKRAKRIRAMPFGWKLGSVSTSPMVKSAMPITRTHADAYSSRPYLRPCMTVPKIIVGITFEDLATIRVV